MKRVLNLSSTKTQLNFLVLSILLQTNMLVMQSVVLKARFSVDLVEFQLNCIVDSNMNFSSTRMVEVVLTNFASRLMSKLKLSKRHVHKRHSLQQTIMKCVRNKKNKQFSIVITNKHLICYKSPYFGIYIYLHSFKCIILFFNI